MIQPPQPNEHAEYYGQYIRRVPADGDLFAILAAQPDELRALLQAVTEDQANVRPAPGEWSVKEVVGHLNDWERILAYRTLSIARGSAAALPSAEPNQMVGGTDFNRRSLSDLLDEFAAQRRANVLCFQPLSEAEWMRMGTASGYPFSVRALLYITCGHVLHHLESLRVTYRVGG